MSSTTRVTPGRCVPLGANSLAPANVPRVDNPPHTPTRWATQWQRALEARSGGSRHDHDFATPAALDALHTWLSTRIDELLNTLGAPITVVDAGAGSGEMLLGTVPRFPAGEVVPIAIDYQPPPPDWPDSWQWCSGEVSAALPMETPGIVLALELLDEIPCDVAQRANGGWHYVLVDGAGVESLGPAVRGTDLLWLQRWAPGVDRAEIGRSRDEFAARVCRRWSAGEVIFVDYTVDATSRHGHPGGTLTGYYRGHQVPPVPDGRRNLTAHVAADSLVSALRPFGDVGRSRLIDLIRSAGIGVDRVWQPLDSWGDFEVVRVTIRGIGESSTPPDGDVAQAR